jgi:hypothetical protein
MQDGLQERHGAKEVSYDRRRLLLQRWSLWLGHVMVSYRVMWCIDDRKNPVPEYYGADFEPPNCEAFDGGKTPKERLIALLKGSISASVYAVTPRETVQRLSEVSSNRKAAEFVASLSGLAGVAGVSAGLQSLRVSDAYYAALRRQPLVVGFTEKGSVTPANNASAELVFGWVLGPTFQISNDGKKTRFRHTVVQRSVSADLVLPAWLDHIVIAPETYWLKEDGTRVASTAASVENSDQPPVASNQEPMTIKLPARPVEVLYAADTRRWRTPKVDRFQYLDVVAGKPASVYIAGENVWRSTEVLIGAQRANSVYLLNNGVIASFDLVMQPLGADTKEFGPDGGTVALTLLTSEGTVEAGRVKVWSAEEKKAADEAAAKLSFSGAEPRMVAGSEYAIELSQALKANESLALRIGSKKDVNLRLLLDPQLAEDRKHAVFVLPAASVPKLKSGNSLVADALVTRATGDVEVFSLIKDGAYYEKEADLEATATGSRAKAGDMVKVQLALPLSSSKGFASLASGKGQLGATMTINGEPQPLKLTADCPLKDDKGCEAQLNVPPSALPNYKKAKDIKLSDLGLKGDDVPKLKADTLTVSLPAAAPASAASAAAPAASTPAATPAKPAASAASGAKL